MARRKSSPKARNKARKARKGGQNEEALLGSPPLEAFAEPSDLELRLQEEMDEYHETSPKLTGGDLDAD